MILVCPNCDARYRLADDAIPERGRKVRCASCQHEWTEAPPPASPAALPPTAEPAPTPAPPTAPLAPEPAPEPEPEPPPRRGGWLKTLVALVLAAALGVAAVAIWGAQWGLDVDDAVEEVLPGVLPRPALPAAADVPLSISFTANLDTLPSGASLLSVTGDVTNPSPTRQPVPPIEAVLHDQAGRAVYTWEVKPPVAALDPGATATFDTTASNFPAGAANLTLDFKQGARTAQ